eukprot:6176328-Pleurochrysis_carterae.AAC.2
MCTIWSCSQSSLRELERADREGAVVAGAGEEPAVAAESSVPHGAVPLATRRQREAHERLLARRGEAVQRDLRAS